MKDSIAVLWDVENVTPSSKSLFVNGLIEYASELGRISVAIAYSDWTRSGMKTIAEVLSENSFELTHVPHNPKQKNSSDITLIARAIEIIYQYPHVKKMVLVTGDADFRPLLQSMRKHGIETIIICDAKSASEDLLLLADSYKDFREILPSADEGQGDSNNDERDEIDGRKGARLSFDESVGLLKEAIQIMDLKKKPTSLGALKIRMKLLNQNFNERELREGPTPQRRLRGAKGEVDKQSNQGKDLKFRSWKEFVLAAVKSDPALELVYDDKDIIIKLKAPVPSGSGKSGQVTSQQDSQSNAVQIPEIIRELLVATRNVQKSRNHGGDPNLFVPYSAVSQYLIDVGLDLREHGYSRIRNLVDAAEKRGLVETHNESQHWMIRLSEEGQVYC